MSSLDDLSKSLKEENDFKSSTISLAEKVMNDFHGLNPLSHKEDALKRALRPTAVESLCLYSERRQRLFSLQSKANELYSPKVMESLLAFDALGNKSYESAIRTAEIAMRRSTIAFPDFPQLIANDIAAINMRADLIKPLISPSLLSLNAMQLEIAELAKPFQEMAKTYSYLLPRAQDLMALHTVFDRVAEETQFLRTNPFLRDQIDKFSRSLGDREPSPAGFDTLDLPIDPLLDIGNSILEGISLLEKRIEGRRAPQEIDQLEDQEIVDPQTGLKIRVSLIIRGLCDLPKYDITATTAFMHFALPIVNDALLDPRSNPLISLALSFAGPVYSWLKPMFCNDDAGRDEARKHPRKTKKTSK